MIETTARSPRRADDAPHLAPAAQTWPVETPGTAHAGVRDQTVRHATGQPAADRVLAGQRPTERESAGQRHGEQPWQTEASTPWTAVVRRIRSLGADTTYVLVTLPWSLVAFVVVFSGLAVAVPLLVLWVGLPVAAGVLVVARWFASVERSRTERRAVLAGDLPLATPRPAAVPGQGAPVGGARPSLSRRVLASLRDPQGWRETVHALTGWILSIVTFTVTVTWWVGAVAGTTVYAWVRYFPENTGNDDLSGAARDALDVLSSTGFKLAAGIFFVLTLLPMTRAMARLQAGFARTLLDEPTLTVTR
mgnify:CR=1 FL=1